MRKIATRIAAALVLAACLLGIWHWRTGRFPWESKPTAQVNTKTNPIDGAEMVFIPGGEFMMGANRPVLARLPFGLLDRIPWVGEGIHERALVAENASPRHRVVVDGFWVYAYEVTNEQYAKSIQVTGRREPPCWGDCRFNQPRQPVVGVSWHDAVAYCEWAGGRLPTEAEWEYVARGGKQYEYATSTGKLTHHTAEANIAGTGGMDKWERSSPVGSFPANPFGLYDLSGNVYEWCSSLYEPYPYKVDDGRENVKDEARIRVLRGGAFLSPHWLASTAVRIRDGPANRHYLIGFRVCASAS